MILFPLEIGYCYIVYFLSRLYIYHLLNIYHQKTKTEIRRKQKNEDKPLTLGQYEKEKQNLDLPISFNGSVFNVNKQLKEER